MNSRDYWDRRRAKLEALTDQRCRLTASEIAKLYDRALSRILERIRALFKRFARGYRLTPEQAVALLTAEQTREARAALQELFDGCEDAALREELRAKLDAPAYAYRISRLEALRDQVYFDAKTIGVEEIKYQEARLEDVYEQSYYRTVFDLSQEQGKNVPFQQLDDPRVAEAVREYWGPSPEELARNFSDRVWENTTELAEQVREIVTEGLVNGGNYREMAAELEAQMGDVQAVKKIQPDGSTRTVLNGSGAKYRAARLIRTEGNHISGQATIRAFQDAGIQRYLYRALLELRTCRVCGGLDGKDFPVSEQRPGVNMHPMHPNCRCFIAPYHDKDWLARYTRSAQTGEKNWEQVPQSMSYAEWYRKYVKVQKGVENNVQRGIINIRGMAMGLRNPASYVLTDTEIESIKADARDLKIPEEVLVFNRGNRTGFVDGLKAINVRGDVLPDVTSNVARDRMSQKAVLAHEYYGHYCNDPSEYEIGDWRDEFRASYEAAVNAPNLSDEDRAYLMIDAYDRKREAGVFDGYDETARRIIYGY